MASTKISALTAASTLTGAETIPVVQGGVTKKVTTDQFLTKDASGNVSVGGTAQFNSRISVGASSFSDTSVRLSGTVGTAAMLIGIYQDITFPATTTSAAYGYTTVLATAAAYTLPSLTHIRAYQNTFAGTVTNQIGFEASSSLIGATNDYGFYGNIPAGAGRWNFYAAGSAANYFGGNVTVGGGGTFGYGTGSGGTATQATSKSTAVTLNKPSGKVATNNAALAAGATVEFTVNNSTVAATDCVTLTPYANGGNYRIEVKSVAAGLFAVRLTNITAGSLSEVVEINFSVVKGATA